MYLTHPSDIAIAHTSEQYICTTISNILTEILTHSTFFLYLFENIDNYISIGTYLPMQP